MEDIPKDIVITIKIDGTETLLSGEISGRYDIDIFPHDGEITAPEWERIVAITEVFLRQFRAKLSEAKRSDIKLKREIDIITKDDE